MQCNIGKTDRTIRLLAGVAIIAAGIWRMSPPAADSFCLFYSPVTLPSSAFSTLSSSSSI